ncbi:DNA helicase RecQ [Kordia algicida OT-1]|uniref:DNA helicase RecQ n=1 Tax=Kordia algicida OT-1 TaxID=391587 RepID=A9DV02_9FLAO|nr:DNA helicase RecQ [Kordia algicida]EDP96356.1 ATP-dependent DNA helicase recQ [Kordia algicida OT-1]
MIAPTTLKNTLKEYFGYDTFRPLQEEIINSIFSGKDNLVIMPTGGGKSICFQLPAILLEGLTIVISPLIALMKDQVDGLTTNGIAAAYLNSSQTEIEQQAIYSEIDAGKIKLLYTAPESLSYLEHIFSSQKISLIAIDEAHCISSWGHDFRPAYTNLGYLKKRFPSIPVIALTATADKATREDIANQLNIPHAKQHIASFDRKNLKLEVRPANDRVKQIISFIDERPTESGIIYCLSRKATETVAEKLQNANINAIAYHAGIAHTKRSKIQEDFINDTCQVICATIAFGMGIDKSNVRWVIHYNLPKNIEGYYQEIGRAGRDGLPSNTLLFHSYADVIQLKKFAESSGNVEVQLAKLDRMKEYADALSCRRKILLSYFGELISEDCGNCDVCNNPPQFFDGTIIAQKALSAVARLKGQEPIGTVIDVLRGAQNSVIQEKNYQELKTYGIAKDIAWLDWKQYITQLINLGYLEIAFHENNKLKLTEFAKDVLFHNKKVDLANLVATKEIFEEQKIKKPKAKKNSLFERLRQLRYKIAQDEDVPAYQIFNDATLREMEAERPMSDEEFIRISGVGRVKMMNYGHDFIKEIISFSKEKKRKRKVDTTKKTYELYQQGFSIEEIAQERKLAQTTIFSHISKLYAEGKDIDMHQFIDKHDLEAIRKAKETLENPHALKPYFEHFQEAISYATIRVGLTILEKEEA